MTDVRENSLRDLLEKISSEQKYNSPDIETSAVPITGANFSSQLFHATIRSIDKKDLKVFAKVAVLNEDFREQAGNVFQTEHYFYTNLARTYKEIEDKHKVSEEHRLFLSKFYGYSNNYLKEVLVLQDLSKDGFVTYDRLKSIDWNYASKSIEEIAKFHALSIAYQKEYPEEYQYATKVLKTAGFEEDGAFAQIIEGSVDRTIQLTKEENRPKVQKFYEKYINGKEFMKFLLPKKRPVIIHSDFRPSNLMHRINEDGKLQIAIIDYQTPSLGCVVTDLLYFIFTGSDGAFRAQYYNQLIELYYENLSANLRRLHLDVKEVFPRHDFDEELKEMLPYGLIVAGVALPLITVDLVDVITTGDGGFGKETLAAMADKTGIANSLCAQRLNEVVDDFVKWGVL